jgi:hypothetical protein
MQSRMPYERSPLNAMKRRERALVSHLPRRRCWHCNRWFTPSSAFIRYCGETCRFLHLHMDDTESERGICNRKHAPTNAGDGDGSMR